MRRRKGHIEWMDLPGLDGAQVGVAHIGPSALREWQLRLRRLQIAELKRVTQLRKELSSDVAPDVFGMDSSQLTIVTPEGGEEAVAMVEAVLTQTVKGVRNWPDMEAATEAEIVEELMRLDLGGELMPRIMEVQTPSSVQFPAAPGAGNDEAGGHTPASD